MEYQTSWINKYCSWINVVNTCRMKHIFQPTHRPVWNVF